MFIMGNDPFKDNNLVTQAASGSESLFIEQGGL